MKSLTNFLHQQQKILICLLKLLLLLYNAVKVLTFQLLVHYANSVLVRSSFLSIEKMAEFSLQHKPF